MSLHTLLTIGTKYENTQRGQGQFVFVSYLLAL